MFITPSDIADTLETMVAAEFPGGKIYRELVETDFIRPCTLIVQKGCTGDVDVGSNIVELRPTFTLTTFVKVDPYHNSHLADLHLRQMRLVGLFLSGFIRVKDRAPKVCGIEMGGGYDYDTVTVTFRYTLNRSDFMNIPQMPVMEQLHTNEEVETHG